jgi:general secretion pathway protein G
MNAPATNRRRITRSRRGMSLVEVMVVIAIILTLMSVLAFGVFSVWENARVETTRLQMGRVQERILIYTVKSKKPPSTGEGLSAVFGDEPVPVDAWGNEFVYVSPGPDGKDYDLISYGRDGVQGGTGNNADLSLADIQ